DIGIRSLAELRVRTSERDGTEGVPAVGQDDVVRPGVGREVSRPRFHPAVPSCVMFWLLVRTTADGVPFKPTAPKEFAALSSSIALPAAYRVSVPDLTGPPLSIMPPPPFNV